MDPVRLYFAGPWTFNKERGTIIGQQITNRLVSYMYPDQLHKWLEFSGKSSGNMLLDSGAFSAWTKGESIDIDSYIQYSLSAIEKARKHHKRLRVVNLDVIPGNPGSSTQLNKVSSKKNLDSLDKSAQIGFKNLLKMKDAGITPIHVFHQGEQFKWLEMMTEHTDYIGVSPANDMSISARITWMESVFTYLQNNHIHVKTHGFAVWMPQVLKTLPFTSTDAASWRIQAAWGGITYPIGGFANPDYSKSPSIIHISQKKSSKGIGILTPEKLKLLETDGYSFEDLQSFDIRCEVNIRYTLGLEKWINEYRKTVDFNPKKTLFQ